MSIILEIKNSINKLQNYNKKNILVLSGGSLKGISYLGVIKALNELNLFNDINIFAGTSIGSIFCFLLSIGYNYNELIDFVYFYNFKNLFSFNIKNFYFNKGLNNGNELIKLLEKFLIKKNLNKNLTFKELYYKTGKLLFINASNITKRKNTCFNFFETPNFKIIKAIRMSMSIPIMFSPVYYNNCYYVDGGIMDSFLYKYIIDFGFPKSNIIGVALFDDFKKTNDTFFNYLMNIYYATFAQSFDNIMKEIICLNITNCNSFTTFNISLEQKKNMINIGYNQTLKYFKNKK
jgi:predicted acylesterase/phospholipase RssA